jgi:hypothetical protein
MPTIGAKPYQLYPRIVKVSQKSFRSIIPVYPGTLHWAACQKHRFRLECHTRRMVSGGEREVTIAVRPAAHLQPRKITKIIGLNGNGFSVLVPYHQARSGFLFKMPIDPSLHEPGPHEIRIEDLIKFTAEDRVKLSYHTDGFAQFSGERPGTITSGRDPLTSEPKGLGLMTHPLKSPIWSGPSIAVVAWGMDDFEPAEDGDWPMIIFEPQEFYFRGCVPAEANSWMLSIYALPMNVVPPVRFTRGCAIVDMALERISGGLLAIVQLKLIHLRREKVFLGLFVSRLLTHFPSKSGWSLNGPGNFTRTKKGHVLVAGYPRVGASVEGSEPLDWKSP